MEASIGEISLKLEKAYHKIVAIMLSCLVAVASVVRPKHGATLNLGETEAFLDLNNA
jgi:hypothetical protein